MTENKKMKRGNSIFIWIQFFCVLFISVSSVFPPLRTFGNYTVLALISMLIWIFICFLRKPDFFTVLPFHRLLIFLFVLYTFTIPYLFGNYSIGNRYITVATIFFFYLVYQFNLEKKEEYINILILKTTLIFAVITTLRTIAGLLENPYLSRSIKSSGEYSDNILRQGIGGFELIYCLVLVNIVCLYFLINRFNSISKKANVYLTFLTVLFTIVIVLSNYFTATNILLISAIFLIGFKLSKTNIPSLFFFIAFLLSILPFSKILVIKLIEAITLILVEGKTLDRLMLIHHQISNNLSITVYDGRESTIIESLNTFMDNFFFGLTITSIETSIDGYLVGFGQHSMIMDTFALFGVITGIIYIYLILRPFIVLLKQNSQYSDLLIVVGLAFLLLNFINNVTPSMGFAVFFVLPTMINYISHKNNKRGANYG